MEVTNQMVMAVVREIVMNGGQVEVKHPDMPFVIAMTVELTGEALTDYNTHWSLIQALKHLAIAYNHLADCLGEDDPVVLALGELTDRVGERGEPRDPDV